MQGFQNLYLIKRGLEKTEAACTENNIMLCYAIIIGSSPIQGLSFLRKFPSFLEPCLSGQFALQYTSKKQTIKKSHFFVVAVAFTYVQKRIKTIRSYSLWRNLQ